MEILYVRDLNLFAYFFILLICTKTKVNYFLIVLCFYLYGLSNSLNCLSNTIVSVTGKYIRTHTTAVKEMFELFSQNISLTQTTY